MPSLRHRALGYLTRREHSRAELAQKLAPHAEAPEELESLLDDLAQRGFLSDNRFAEEYVRAKGRRFGAKRLVYELREKGVAEGDIAAALDGMDDDELARARQVWLAKFGELPADLAARAKQTRFLAGRGFSSETIRQVLRGSFEE